MLAANRFPTGLLVLAALCACGWGRGPAAEGAAAPASALEDPNAGFVVWESNRYDAWRIWISALDGSQARQLTENRPGRRQCCPQISPDGRWITYLRIEPGQKFYPPEGALGELRRVRPDGKKDKVLLPQVRTYYENRAVVWRSPKELIFIGADRRTYLLDVRSRSVVPLTPGRVKRTGLLIDPQLAWGSTGRRGFWPYKPDRPGFGKVVRVGGCQFFFSQDGRFGYWVQTAGGPIRGIEFATGRTFRILKRDDPRMPPGLGYLYFPMLSADRTLLAFAASPNEHDHFKGDYDLFLAETDPETLDLVGDPVRLTYHPSTDRYPDVYRAPARGSSR